MTMKIATAMFMTSMCHHPFHLSTTRLGAIVHPWVPLSPPILRPADCGERWDPHGYPRGSGAAPTGFDSIRSLEDCMRGSEGSDRVPAVSSVDVLLQQPFGDEKVIHFLPRGLSA